MLSRYIDEYEWKIIQNRLSKILNRDLTYDFVTKTINEFINLFEEQQKELEAWRKDSMF